MTPDDSPSSDQIDAQVAGIQRAARSRWIDTLTRLVVALMVIGGLATASTTESDMWVTALVSLALATCAGLTSTLRYAVLMRNLRLAPEATLERLRRRRWIRRWHFAGT